MKKYVVDLAIQFSKKSILRLMVVTETTRQRWSYYKVGFPKISLNLRLCFNVVNSGQFLLKNLSQTHATC